MKNEQEWLTGKSKMAVSPINTGTTPTTPTTPVGDSTTVLAKTFNSILQKVLDAAKENAGN